MPGHDCQAMASLYRLLMAYPSPKDHEGGVLRQLLYQKGREQSENDIIRMATVPICPILRQRFTMEVGISIGVMIGACPTSSS
jgi:hypothetical protein